MGTVAGLAVGPVGGVDGEVGMSGALLCAVADGPSAGTSDCAHGVLSVH